MDVLLLSRLQFAITTIFHFMFVPLTLGLSLLVAWMETKYVRTGDELYLRMTKFWGRIFLVNFAIGVVTGITLEFQFGTNWSRYSAYVGDIFGSLLAIEATVAFFLESTLLGVWIFGWNKVSKRVHASIIWLVALGSNLSAYWIIAANAWMQHPVGYTIRNNRAELTDFWSVMLQPFAINEFVHTLSAAFVLSSMFVMSVSAWQLLRKQHVEFFQRSFRMAVLFGFICSVLVVVSGHHHGFEVAEKQPAKMAAMESHWETTTRAPIFILAWPSQCEGRNVIQIGRIPGVLSLLAFHDPAAEVIGLRSIPRDEWPPVLITFLSFRGMVGLGFFFVALLGLAWYLRDRLMDHPWLLKLMLFSIPLPYAAIQLGWIVAEVGRQPWIVYGLMRTSDAGSPIDLTQVVLTFIGFVVVYSFIGIAGFTIIIKKILHGPPSESTSV